MVPLPRISVKFIGAYYIARTRRAYLKTNQVRAVNGQAIVVGPYRSSGSFSDDSDVSANSVPFYPGGNRPLGDQVKRGVVGGVNIIVRPVKTSARLEFSAPSVIPERIRRRSASPGRGYARRA